MSKGINKNTHKLSGVYEIRNTLNNKRYIGSSINIYRRWRDHKRMLNLSVHPNKHLQSAWNKYGEKHKDGNFIAEYSSQKEAALLVFGNERYHKSISGCCRGDRKEAKGYIWRYKTDNYPNKIKLCLADRYKNNKKAVYQIDPATEEIIAEYSSTKEAAMQFSKSTYSSISLCCNGKYKTAFGFKWKYKNYDNKIDINQNSDS